MEALVLDGKSYVKASKAARDLGYATDYVGQLCRSGQVDAHLIGRTWYVDQEQLGAHRVEKKRMSRTKAREQAKALIASTRAASQAGKTPSSRIMAKNGPISYESDEAPLIPETRKLSIVSDHEAPEVVVDEPFETLIEEDPEEILVPEDVEKEEVLEDTSEEEVVVLKPQVVYEESERPRGQILRSEGVSDIRSPAPISFIERLEEASAIKENPKATVVVVPARSQGGSKYSLFIHILFHLAVIAAVLASLAFRLIMTYDVSRTPSFESHFLFSIDEGIAALQERFLSK